MLAKNSKVDAFNSDEAKPAVVSGLFTLSFWHPVQSGHFLTMRRTHVFL